MYIDRTTRKMLGLSSCIDLGLDRLEVLDDSDYSDTLVDTFVMDGVWNAAPEIPTPDYDTRWEEEAS